MVGIGRDRGLGTSHRLFRQGSVPLVWGHVTTGVWGIMGSCDHGGLGYHGGDWEGPGFVDEPPSVPSGICPVGLGPCDRGGLGYHGGDWDEGPG
jgi:hypothetical protein